MPSRVHPIVLYLLAGLLGLCYFFTVYDWGFLTGQSAFWQAPHPDQMQALTGWYAYAHDSWRFPLFEVRNLRYPQGANIIFTDSIPLLALLFKPVAHWLPKDFHYFGIWIALCFGLQAVVAMAILLAWGVKSHLILVAGMLMALSTPAWLVRHNHLALCGHFLVLLGVLAYIRTQQAGRTLNMLGWWCALGVAALLVHLYLLAMVLALFLAALAQRLFAKRNQWRTELIPAIASPIAVAAAIVAVALLSGHFRGEAVQDASKGFGTYSMNLMHPWYPQGLIQLPGPLPVLDATGGQYEGFNFQGLGALLLILGAIVLARRSWSPASRRNAFLLLALFLLTFFSLSNRVYFGPKAVLKYRVPWRIEKPVELFRSSGRFFWPVGYVLVLGSIAMLARERERRRWVIVIVLGAAALQLVDSEPARAFPYADVRIPQPTVLPPSVWQPVVEAHDLLRPFPGFFCGPAENHRLSQELQLIAARAGTPVTTVFMARQVDDCFAERKLVDTLTPGPRELVVYLPPFRLEHTVPSFPDSAACREFPHGLACSQQFLESDPAPPAGESVVGEPYFRNVGPAPNPISVGQRLPVHQGTPGETLLASGWYAAEADGAWMRGARAKLVVPVKAPPDGPVRLRFLAKCYLSAKHPQKSLQVILNGDFAGTVALETWEPREHELDVPADAFANGAPLRVEFILDPVSSPAADGVSEDTRELGIQLQQLALLPVQQP